MAQGFDRRVMRTRDLTTGRFTKVIPNLKTINGPMRLTPLMQAELKRHAEAVVEQAKGIARSDAYETGDYYRGLRAAAGIDKAPGAGETAVARANAFDWKSHWIEWGTQTGFRPRHVLTRAAEAAGYSLAKSGKNFRRILAGGAGVWSSKLRFSR